ncbi:MAG: LacI family DNA-binding transcriptional regulator [Chloroflexota bacterium]
MTTIHDVANLAKVSTATVSNAFNWPDKVKPDTYERVVAAAKSLDYQPNVFGKGLSSGRTFNVGLLISDIRVPIVANITRGIEDKLTEAGFVPIISSTDGESEKTLQRVDQLRRLGACGYILVPAQYGVTLKLVDQLEQLVQEGIPTIISGHDIESTRISSVTHIGRQMARDLTQHLIDLNHRNIAYIGSYFSLGRGKQRWAGFQEAMTDGNIPIRNDLVSEVESLPAESFAAMEKLMTLAKPPTAIFAMNDIIARGVIDYITQFQVKVPQELSIVTFDYLALAQRTTPPITSIVAPAYELGVKTAELFLSQQTERKHQADVVHLPYRFEDRGSTMAHRAC